MHNKFVKAGVFLVFLILLTAVSAAQTQHPPAGHWTFDEGSGQIVHDSAGNNDGYRGADTSTEQSDPSWTTGLVGSALDFDEDKQQYVRVPHDASLNRNTITMAAWVHPSSYSDHGYGIITAKESSYKMAIRDDGELMAAINGNCPGNWCDDGGNGWVHSGQTIPKNQWTHVAATWDGEKFVFYVNGQNIQENHPSEVTSHTDIVDSTYDFGIGARSVGGEYNGPRKFFDGKIDDVRVYEDVMTEDDFEHGDNTNCNGGCSPTVINIHQDVTNNYDYTYNYDYTTYNYTYNDYAYNTYNQYNYTFNDYETNYYNYDYTNYTTINQYETNEYNYENNYQEENTYIYYNFGGDCPESGCEYVCQQQNCEDQMNGGSDAPVLTNNVDLELIEAAYPRTIGAGQEIQFQITVRNQGELDADNVVLQVQAYGQLKKIENLNLASGRQETFTVPFTVPQRASGPEDVQIEATALNAQGNVMERDIATVPIEVQDIHLTMHLDPQRVVAGEPVTVSGQMNQEQLDARLYVDGSYITTVTSDERKHYSHSLMTHQPGVFRIELRAGNARSTRFLRVDPKVGIIDTNIPETVNTQDNFQACATVFSATQGQVALDMLVDGQVKSTNTFSVQGEQEKCFSTSIRDEGEHDITFRAKRNGVTDEKTQTVNVIESRIEVNVFPQQITLETGHSGVFQVKLQNKDAGSRTFHIQVHGLSDITETTDEQVALGRGDKRTVFIRVTPPETGRYQGNITVTSEGNTFADTQVTVFANENPALRGPLSRAGETVQEAVRYVQDRAAAIGIGLGVLVILAILGIFLYRRARRSEVIEPRY